MKWNGLLSIAHSMISWHLGDPRELPWLVKGAIYKPHLEVESLPLWSNFCDGTRKGGAL
jgi:hypothetical protein